VALRLKGPYLLGFSGSGCLLVSLILSPFCSPDVRSLGGKKRPADLASPETGFEPVAAPSPVARYQMPPGLWQPFMLAVRSQGRDGPHRSGAARGL